MHAFSFTPLLAQELAFPSRPVLIMGGVIAFLLVVAVYLAFLSIPTLRSAIRDAQRERDAMGLQLEAETADAKQQIESQRRAAEKQQRDREEVADRRMGDLRRQIARLEKEAESFAELPALRSELCDAKLANHVGARLQSRLEQTIRERQTKTDTQLQQAREALSRSQRQALELYHELRDAELERHVQCRKQQRLSKAARLESDSQRQATAAAQRQLRDATLDIHVRRRLEERLATRLREQSDVLHTSSAQLGDLNEQVESLQNTVRAQSESMINNKLAEVQREGERLRDLQDRLQSSDLSPQECLEAMAALTNGRSANC